MADRVHKTMMNAKVGLVFYFTSIVLAFFSRRIFLECLGDTFIGLSGTIGSILEFLNISEIGIGTCIGYFLYKPIESRDQEKIKEIVSLFGYLYSIVGTVILSGALIISIFLPFVFADKGVSLYLVYSTFFAFLGSQLIGYFLNYRRILIDSDQKTYKLAIWTQSFNICKILAQMALAYHFHSPYIWLAIELGFNLFTCWLINRIVNREYPWLVTDRRRGKEVLKKYPEILVKAKQIVIHRLKNFFLSKSDEILVFAFESLQMVAYYGNYMMIVGKLTALFNSVLTGMNASIGNLVAEGNKWNIRKVFWEYLTFRYWTTGIFIIALAFLVNPLIGWWLGPQYILQDYIVILILLNMYIMLTRPSVDLFINAYGLYDDVWAAYAEGIINLTVTLVVGYFYGLVGILLGKIVSMILMVVIWKPYYLYKRGFQESVFTYWRHTLTHLVILAGIIAANYATIHYLHWKIGTTLPSMFGYALCILLPILLLYSVMVYLFCPGSRDLISRVPFIRKKSN